MPPTKGIVRSRYDGWLETPTPTLAANPLEKALAAIGLATWHFDLRTLDLAHAGAPIASLLGRLPDAAVDASSLWLSIVHPADRAWLVGYRDLMQGDPLAITYECSYRVLMGDGRERWLREVAQIERDGARQPIAIAGVLSDITDRREQEERRAEGAERFRAAFEDAATGIAMVGLDGDFLEVNREFSEIVGLPIAKLLEMKLADIQLADAANATGDAPANLTSPGAEPRRRERRYQRAGGDPRWVIESESVIHDGEARPRYYVVQALDVTERRNAQSALLSAEAQLLQAQKMEALGQLAGGVAHDFNNLLTVIRSYSQMVLETLDPSTANHEDLTEVVAAADRAATLTKQLLAFSRKQAQHWQSLRVDGIVTEMERMLQRLIGTSAELIVDVASATAQVEGDKGQIEQVIMNLVVNARDAMPNGGRITVMTRDVHLEEATRDTVPSVVFAGDYVLLEVRDTGTGMDAATIAHIFEPFFTTKAAGYGTGLGLSTVYGIVQQCGGRLVVSSVPGEGSRFSVYLPHRIDDVLAGDGGEARAVEGGSETVLVIEDDESVRTLTRHVLVRLGYAVLAARDASEALRIARAFDAGIDLLLCDVHLPGASGYRAAAQIRESYPAAKVLFMSGHMDVSIPEAERSPMVEAFQALDVFPKPFAVEQLAHAIRDVLDANADALTIEEVRA